MQVGRQGDSAPRASFILGGGEKTASFFLGVGVAPPRYLVRCVFKSVLKLLPWV